MVWEALKSNLILPQMTRFGSIAAGILIGAGVESGHASILGTAAPVALLVSIDYALAWFRKRSIQRKTEEKVLANVQV